VEIVVTILALKEVSLRVRPFHPVTTIAPVLTVIILFIYHRRYMISVINNVAKNRFEQPHPPQPFFSQPQV
jgi:hypothetical protein